MLEALRFALNTLEKGIEVRIQDSWPALKAILPETIAKVKDAIERAEADLGAQRQPSSVVKIQAETKAVARELENTLKPMPIEIEQHPADREPTDEEVERAALIYDPQINGYGQEFACFKAKDDVKCALKAWQQVWREQE